MKKNEIIRRYAYTPARLYVRESPEGEPPSRTITGYAILFGIPSEPLWQDEDGEAREVIDSSAVTRGLLDSCDIKMTMFHNRQLLLARSNRGSGTLTYDIDERGVKFSFEAPSTVDGDKALELVRRGDIGGCSFAFSTRYYDETCVKHTSVMADGKVRETYNVKVITGIYDFTLTDNPAYTDTSVEAREFVEELRAGKNTDFRNNEKISGQLRKMRQAAAVRII